MPFIIGTGKDTPKDLDAFPRYLEFCDFAEDWAARVNTGFSAVDYIGLTPQKSKVKFANRVITKLRELYATKHALTKRTSSLTKDEVTFLYRKLFDFMSVKHAPMWGAMAPHIVDVDQFVNAFYERMFDPGKLQGEFRLSYESSDPVVPIYARCYDLPPDLKSSPISVELTAFIGSHEEENVSLFFDSMQSAHMEDVSLLINLGQNKDIMRQKGKDKGSRYSYTTLADFEWNGVTKDLMTGFLQRKAEVPLDGTRFDYSIQGQKTGNTRIELSAVYVCEHYYAYLHCYPG